MPELTSAALFEKDGKALIVHRRRPPLAGQWLLPLARVADTETAEEVLRRHAREQFGVDVAAETFVETVYITDPEDQQRYVANIFRAPLGEGPMRFNAEGDYDDARWVAPAELEQLWMPPDLRVPLVQILTNPGALHETDWSQLSAQALPLGEVGAQPVTPIAADDMPAPDNIASWNTVVTAYQHDYYGDRDAGRLKWSRGIFEDELHLLGDVAGMRALVVGSGGGQDAVALSAMGAVAVGIDPSSKQVDYAKKYAQRHDAANAAFVEGSAEDLTRFDDASFDAAVSIHALQYVERIEDAVAELARVVKPGGLLAITVPHPFNATLADGPPYEIARSYWCGYLDHDWTFADGTSAPFRDYVRTVGQLSDLLDAAGFAVERVVEPRQHALEGDDAEGWDARRAALVPWVLIIKARKR